MTMTPSQIELADSGDRETAIATLDRNLVVTAGAGTGKTTLLVDRMIHLLLRNPDPLEITEIVALTFTNKAADEMRLRLRQQLQAYVNVNLANATHPAQNEDYKDVQRFLALYELSKDELDCRIPKPLRNVRRG